MSYRITIPEDVTDELLERAPAGTLSRLRTYLKHVALTLAQEEPQARALEKDEGERCRFDYGGWTAWFAIDEQVREIRVHGCGLTDRMRGLAPADAWHGWSRKA